MPKDLFQLLQERERALERHDVSLEDEAGEDEEEAAASDDIPTTPEPPPAPRASGRRRRETLRADVCEAFAKVSHLGPADAARELHRLGIKRPQGGEPTANWVSQYRLRETFKNQGEKSESSAAISRKPVPKASETTKKGLNLDMRIEVRLTYDGDE